MDPLSLAISVGSLLSAATAVSKAVNDIRKQFNRAEGTITAISAECTIITTTLTQIVNFAKNDPAAFTTRLQARDGAQLVGLDVQMQNALECCDITLIALNDVLRKCNVKKEKGFMAFRGKAMFFFSESELKDRLQTLRGLNQAMLGLVTAIQANSVATIRQILQQNSVTMQTTVQRSNTLRKTYAGSIINGTSTNFDFGDQVINSQAYRRAFRAFSKEPIPKDTNFPDEDCTMAAFNEGASQFDSSTLHTTAPVKQIEKSPVPVAPKSPKSPHSNQLPERSKNVPALDEAKQAEMQKILRSAAQGGNIQLVKFLLGRGAVINSTDDNGFTPLHLTVKHGHVECISTLLEHGADVEAEAIERYSRPLHIACNSKAKNDIIAKLISEGKADITAQNSSSNHPIHLACIHRDLDMVKVLLEAGASIESVGCLGWHPLHHTSENLQLPIVTHLLEKGAEIDSRSQDGDTPLRILAEYKGPAIVEFLLDKGADVNARNHAGGTPLILAAANNRVDMIEVFLKHGAKINLANDKGSAPLHWAVFKDARDATKVLLEHKADIDAGTSNGRLPIHIASNSMSIGTAELLLKSGADIEAKVQKSGWTALHWAAKKGLPEMVKFLIKNGANKEVCDKSEDRPIHCAIMQGRFDVVKVLLEEGVGLEARGSNQRTPLHMAAHNTSDAIVKLLLEKGADFEAVGGNEWRVIHYAAASGPVTTLDLLIEAGANIHSAADELKQAIHVAAMKGSTANVRRLLEAGASITTTGKSNWQPIHYAAGNGMSGNVELLLDKGADTNVQSEVGSTPLHLAACHHTAQLLLKRGARVDLTTNDRKTPLHDACEKGHIWIVDILIKAGANKAATESTGKTPVELAVVNGHAKVVDILYS